MSRRDENLLWNLKRHGAPLVAQGVPGKLLSVEETLAKSLRLSRARADVARVWPVVFARNKENVDFEKLSSFSGEVGQMKALGFFMELSGRLMKDRSVLRQAKRLLPEAKGNVERFSLRPRKKRAILLEKMRTPAFVRKWRFVMNATLESFRSCFSRFTVNHAPFY